MTTTKVIALIAVAALTEAAAFAGDLAATSVTNAKGQQSVLYRDTETAVAVGFSTWPEKQFEADVPTLKTVV